MYFVFIFCFIILYTYCTALFDVPGKKVVYNKYIYLLSNTLQFRFRWYLINYEVSCNFRLITESTVYAGVENVSWL